MSARNPFRLAGLRLCILLGLVAGGRAGGSGGAASGNAHH